MVFLKDERGKETRYYCVHCGVTVCVAPCFKLCHSVPIIKKCFFVSDLPWACFYLLHGVLHYATHTKRPKNVKTAWHFVHSGEKPIWQRK